MLFDFLTYIDELRENPEKKEVIEKYEKIYGIIEGDIKDQIWYKEYISMFDTIDYKVPEELFEDFDWKLLMQLVASSLSSDGYIDYKEGNDISEFTISVQSGDQAVVKNVKDLWGFQISRLYEIYIEEQMNLQILLHDEEQEKEAILQQRDAKKNRWELLLKTLTSKKDEIDSEKKKQKELTDLMGKL